MKEKLFWLLVVSHIVIIQSCSVLQTYTTYKVPDGWQKSTEHIFQWKHSYDDYVKINENINGLGILPGTKFIVNTCFIRGSIMIYPEDILGYAWFIGPAYIPVIPNLIEPFRYLSKSKRTDYYVMISFGKSDSIIKVADLEFFKNKKEIFPKSIEEIEFTDERNQDMYVVNSKWIDNNINECLLYPSKTYLFIFSINKNTFKSIEIRYNNDLFINIKRKIKMGHDIYTTH